ncbi:unnamed protein product [Spirodela intermedia]|uniref:DYW domain-containing protein n=1 Tax=Spirodela intermedia TaxID=51605 RepID=A0A7I8L926_SPIIN|nr:unnamed protein product [Spirodela intermedia]
METVLCSDPTALPQPGTTKPSWESLSSVKQSHAQILKSPRRPSRDLVAKLVAVYGKFGDVSSAVRAFAASPWPPDAFLFNSLIQAHVCNSLFLRSFIIYREMLDNGVAPNRYTFPPLFKACSCATQLTCGKQLHAHSTKRGLTGDPFVAAALVDMYMKNGEVNGARRMFDGMKTRDVVLWSALLAGYSQNGLPQEALQVYEQMRRAGVAVDNVAVVSAIAACSQLQELHLAGGGLHSLALKSGFVAEVVVGTALVDMYASCGELPAAKQMFGEMHHKDLVAWNCLINWWAEKGPPLEAFKLFVEMQRSRRLKPNGSSLAGLLPAIARCGSLQLGKSCHGFMLRRNFGSDEFVVTALMDVYAKSGDLVVARKLFDGICSRNVISWSAMIAGCGAHGRVEEALSLFDEMLRRGIRPNHITYIGVLSACVHGGFVDEGRRYFLQMIEHHSITPSLQHYTCMVDLLGRAGLFEEARELIRGMPAEPPPEIWGALMGACRIHGNVKLGKYAAEKLFELKPADPGFYVLLSNIYAAAHMWSEVRRVRGLMRELGLRKPVGWSSVEIGCRIHSFLSGDKSHPDSDEVYERLGELISKAKETGYVPRKEVVLHDVEDDVKESVLSSHSEKLAMAYGWSRLMSGKPIRIMKNLRTCEDCHSFAKFVSTVTHREIILRDAVRFHHIKDGICTCSDYW